MQNVFEIIDKTGRKIRLTKERWNHITKHSYMTNYLEDIKKALENPTTIMDQKFDKTMKNYYFHYKLKNRYLLVGVKYLNGEGFVTTAFITRKIIRRWHKT
jgi:hypothetical protein